MKKILCLIDTLGFGGGAERQMAGLAGFLKQRGENVILAAYHQHNMDEFIHENHGIRPVLLDAKPNPLSKMQAVRRFIKKEKFDIVIAYKDGPAMMCCMMKATGMIFRLIVSERNTTQLLTMREKVKFILYRWADVVVSNSESQHEFINARFSSLREKTMVITNFTDTRHFVPSEKQRCEGQFKILTVARIAKQKNVLAYLRVIKQVIAQRDDVAFEWYGKVQIGEKDYHAQCLELIDELGIGNHVRFLPATQNIVEKYQECDVFCLPSLYEGYPNALCEAMSCGKPILCSRVCDNPQIVNEGENGMMFDPKSVDEMSRVVLKLLSLSKEERMVMGTRSRELSVERFSEEVFVNKYLKLIESQP